MMFATLDDLEGTVELTIFEKALAECESALAVDEVVLVRGRFERKDGGKVGVVVQDVTAFKPSEEEVERSEGPGVPARPRPQAGARADRRQAARGDDHRRAQARARAYPGETEVVLDIDTSGGRRLLRLGAGIPGRGDAEPARRARPHPRAARAGAAAGAGRRRDLSLRFVSFGMTCRRDLCSGRDCGPSLYRWTGGGGSH